MSQENQEAREFPFALDKQERYTFQELTQLVALLRAPGGCPWDREQTWESMGRYLRNETNETLEAIAAGDGENLCEELGDVLFQILLISQIAREQGDFTLEDVVDGIMRKMIRRHPHVFAGVRLESREQGKAMWQSIKEEERRERLSKREKLEKSPLTKQI